MGRADSLKKTLMLGKTEGRRRWWQRIRWLDMSLSKLQELVMDGEAWHATVHGVAEIRLSNWTELNTILALYDSSFLIFLALFFFLLFLALFPPGSSDSKEAACKMGSLEPHLEDLQELLEKGMATHSSILGQRNLADYSPWGRKESDMTEQLTFHFNPKWSCVPYVIWDSLMPQVVKNMPAM